MIRIFSRRQIVEWQRFIFRSKLVNELEIVISTIQIAPFGAKPKLCKYDRAQRDFLYWTSFETCEYASVLPAQQCDPGIRIEKIAHESGGRFSKSPSSPRTNSPCHRPDSSSSHAV